MSFHSGDLAAVPIRVPLVDGVAQFLSRFWLRYFQSVVDVVNKSARKLVLFAVTEKNAALGATALNTGSLNPGVYRTSYTTRVTTAATTSSSVTVTLGWTDGTQSISQSGAAMTGNTVTSAQNGTVLMHIDEGTDITYATTYASSGATDMQYSLYVLAEKIG